ncbi:MAG: Adenosylhomocysteinase [Candidatus Carbobacillus altaicus]|uniref:Adenosylhomocysteinase n=1 Tax=Candidatus Carbonibacillus altaicus TaxID=2163959 RepID=A0A2R6XXH9_9BACL|nr:MAG: Adenosylhomocysteinase [Candidatus Carbobacillus altaicus]
MPRNIKLKNEQDEAERVEKTVHEEDDRRAVSDLAAPDQAPSGQKKIAWARAHMPVLRQIEEQFLSLKPFQGERITIALHLEAKTAYLAQVLRSGGADVAITGSNPLSTQDDVAAALAQNGVTVYARYGMDQAVYTSFLDRLIDLRPTLLIDDGGDLVSRLIERDEPWARTIIGGAEETTTGVTRLKALAREGRLPFPMVAVNDAKMKHLFDNRYGTGQSVFDGIMRTTNVSIAGKTVVVAGYGWCGRGVAERARGLGARVIVTEVDPVKALEAYMDGHQVMTMDQAAEEGDIFITVSGNIGVIGSRHFPRLKDGAMLANAGHFDVEIDLVALRSMALDWQEVRPNVEAVMLEGGKIVYVLASGRLINLAAADGHPAEVMDMTFALQALTLSDLIKRARAGCRLSPGVHAVPDAIDQEVARLKLKAFGLTIDALSTAQETYLESWQIGSPNITEEHK